MQVVKQIFEGFDHKRLLSPKLCFELVFMDIAIAISQIILCQKFVQHYFPAHCSNTPSIFVTHYATIFQLFKYIQLIF